MGFRLEIGAGLLSSRRCIWSCFSEPSFPSGLFLTGGWAGSRTWPVLCPHPSHALLVLAGDLSWGQDVPLPGGRTGPSTVGSVVSPAGSAAVSCHGDHTCHCSSSHVLTYRWGSLPLFSVATGPPPGPAETARRAPAWSCTD